MDTRAVRIEELPENVLVFFAGLVHQTPITGLLEYRMEQGTGWTKYYLCVESVTRPFTLGIMLKSPS